MPGVSPRERVSTSVRLRHVQQCLKNVDPEGYRLRKAESRQLRSKLESNARMDGLVKMLLRVAGPTGEVSKAWTETSEGEESLLVSHGRR